MIVNIFNAQSTLKILHKKVKAQVKAILGNEKVLSDEVNVYFVSKSKIRDLHCEFFKDFSATDCISFPIDPPDVAGLLGEVFICPEVAKEYTLKNGLDIKEEISLYLVHGLLHLIGLEDYPESKNKIMRKREKFYITFLKEKNLL